AAQRKQAAKAPPQPATRQRQQKPRQGKVTKTRYTPKQKAAKSGGLFETTLIVISVLALYFAYIIFFLI
ncbi:protein kinase family protein, partial [Bacillus inaquosorum]|nr:protein kinase family protein [Bacillus inaquosorum]